MTMATNSDDRDLVVVREGDGGLLFGLAVLVAVGSAFVLVFRRRQLPVVGHLLPAP